MSGPDERASEVVYQEALVTNDGIDMSGYSNPQTFAEAEVFVGDLLGKNKFGEFSTVTGNSTSRPAGLRAFATMIDNVVEELTRSGKLPAFILSQTALHLLNPAVSTHYGNQRQAVNPLALILGPPPWLGGLTTDSVNPILAGQNPVTNGNKDTLRRMYDGTNVEVITQAGVPPIEIRGPQTRFPSDDGGAISSAAAGLVGQIGGFDPTGIGGVTLDQKAKELNLIDKGPAGISPDQTFENTTIFEAAGAKSIGMTDDQTASKRAAFIADGVLRPNLAALFEKDNVGPGFGGGQRGDGYSAVKRGLLGPLTANALAQRNAQKHIDSFMTTETRKFEQNNGYLDQLLPDSATVVPLYFQDLRSPNRYLYFKAFLTNLQEKITPEWNSERFYGRVDPVGTYMNTVRTFSVSFMVVAMSQEGLTTMWRKINNLCKMLYPTFKAGVLTKAPVVRLRIGDLCADGQGRGLPGWINGISFDYTNAPWEILRDLGGTTELETGIVPMWATISFEFQVIHETTPKVDINYNFPTNTFRKMGTLHRDNSNTATAAAQQDRSEAESRDSPTVGAPASSDEGVSTP